MCRSLFSHLVLVAALLLTAAWPPASLAQSQQNTLRIRLNADIRSTDPGMNRDANTDAVVLHMVEGLVAYREDTSVAPLLAQSIQVSPDGKVYTFKLRPNLKFHNGAPVTADDVLFAWNRYMKPENNWRCVVDFDGRGISKVVKTEARDPLTVVFTLEQPAALFLATMARTDCGGTGIYHRSSLDADGKWQDPVGTGPFKMGDRKRGQYVELQRFEAYAALPGKRDGNTGNKTTELAKVRFVVIPDESAAKAALLSGAIDMNFNIGEEDLPEYKERKDISVAMSPSMDLVGMLFQTRDPLLKDVRIRRAIALALDVPQIVEAVSFGSAKPNRSVIPVASGFHAAAQAEVPKRNIAAAKKLLAEAGYKGEAIKILTTKRYSGLFEIAVLAQAMALEAGIKIDVEVLDWATLLDRYTKGNYQAMSFTYSARFDPSLSYQMISGLKDLRPARVWESPEALELVDKSMVATDRAERQALFNKLDVKLREDVPAIFMFSGGKTSAAKFYVKGYQGWAAGLPRAWGVSVR